MAKKRRAPRGVTITNPDGSTTRVDNHVDSFGQINTDRRQMLELFAGLGSQAQILWNRAQERQIDSRTQSRQDNRANPLLTGAAAGELNQRENEIMGGLTAYLRQRDRSHVNQVQRMRMANMNYLRQLRAASKLQANTLQRNLELMAGLGVGGGGGSGGGGSRGGGGGGGGGGSGSSSGSGAPGAPTGAEGADGNGRGGREQGNFQIIYPNLDPNMVSQMMNVPNERIQSIMANSWAAEFTTAVNNLVANEQIPPAVAIRQLLPRFENMPGVDLLELSDLAQHTKNYFELAGGMISEEEVAPRVITENVRDALGFQGDRLTNDPIDEAQRTADEQAYWEKQYEATGGEDAFDYQSMTGEEEIPRGPVGTALNWANENRMNALGTLAPLAGLVGGPMVGTTAAAASGFDALGGTDAISGLLDRVGITGNPETSETEKMVASWNQQDELPDEEKQKLAQTLRGLLPDPLWFALQDATPLPDEGDTADPPSTWVSNRAGNSPDSMYQKLMQEKSDRENPNDNWFAKLIESIQKNEADRQAAAARASATLALLGGTANNSISSGDRRTMVAAATGTAPIGIPGAPQPTVPFSLAPIDPGTGSSGGSTPRPTRPNRMDSN